MAVPAVLIEDYALADRYVRTEGRVFLTGTQALVRVLLDQARRDRLTGLKTAGFVSGYRGSPLGSVDRELWNAAGLIAEGGIDFLPAVNEDLAATAVLGSQQVETSAGREVEGVFAMWYGKGPGVDRAGDALKHGNAYGSSPHGGVLVVAGDDHGCVSSSMPHQSDVAFMSWFMPTLNPANVAEYLTFGEYGYALSRFSGMWVGFKALSETVESAASVDLCADRLFQPPRFAPPPGGLHYRWPDLPGPQIEERMEAKKHAVMAFAEANPIDRRIYNVKDAVFGIVTTGKGHLDLMEALRLLGVDEAACRRLGIDIYKVGMVWPLPRRSALEFVRGKREVLVIEEKRGIVESQLKEYFYDWPGDKPDRMVGKNDEQLKRLVPWTGELSPLQLVPLVARRLDGVFPEEGFLARAQELTQAAPIQLSVPGAVRTPYFCSGCPHNTSTKVPDGSQALAGIGCHFMASWMDRNTTSLIQMGGEGVNWAASSKFTGKGHIFQNLGEGTWYHSGSMAIRQAIAAGANMTYKILYNDAVAMTGGQPIDGPISVEGIAQTSRAEGINRIALVSDAPGKFDPGAFPAGTTIHHRRDLDLVQRELREVPGVSALIYEQACATEKRRRRKRGLLDDPKRFVVINELVCEGCGDCSVESNCLSVEPVETEFGRKRRINQSSCNKDFSCLNGFCPSFVTVEGAARKERDSLSGDVEALAGQLTDPKLPALDRPYNLVVTGVGGTGVVTVGALITMAAHLEGKGVSVLDFTGFAQKFGTVISYIRLAGAPSDLNQVRVDVGAADALVGCDVVVSSSPKASISYRKGMKSVVNAAEMPTGDLVRARDASLEVESRLTVISDAVGTENLSVLNANRVADRLLGDTVYANIIMLGCAWQTGLLPVGLTALQRAIALNGVKPERNQQAFAIGRVLAENPSAFSTALDDAPKSADSFETILRRRAAFLTDYQDAAYAASYEEPIRAFSRAVGDDVRLSVAAAKSLFRLMSYKDEYEVARLHADRAFVEKLQDEFKAGYRVVHHLAPPVLNFVGKDARGRPRKRGFGPWIRPVFRVLSRMKRLRGTPFDPFGYTAERRAERRRIQWYLDWLDRCALNARPDDYEVWAEILEAPLEIRGYGSVKEKAFEEAQARIAELEPQLNHTKPSAPHEEQAQARVA